MIPNNIEHLERFQPLFYAVFRGQNSQSNDSILKPSKNTLLTLFQNRKRVTIFVVTLNHLFVNVKL